MKINFSSLKKDELTVARSVSHNIYQPLAHPLMRRQPAKLVFRLAKRQEHELGLSSLHSLRKEWLALNSNFPRFRSLEILILHIQRAKSKYLCDIGNSTFMPVELELRSAE